MWLPCLLLGTFWSPDTTTFSISTTHSRVNRFVKGDGRGEITSYFVVRKAQIHFFAFYSLKKLFHVGNSG